MAKYRNYQDIFIQEADYDQKVIHKKNLIYFQQVNIQQKKKKNQGGLKLIKMDGYVLIKI